MAHILQQIAFLSFIGLSGCSTTPTPVSQAALAPASRVYYTSADTPEAATVVFVRDSGLVGSGVYHHIFVNDEKAVSLDVGEKAILKLAPGEYVFGVNQTDPFGLWNPFTIDQKLEPNKTYRYRLSLDSTPPPRIQRIMTK